MFLVDTTQGRIVDDEEIKADLAAEHPYEEWLHGGLVHLDDLPDRPHIRYPHSRVVRRQLTFGYTTEELKLLMAPMARTGGEALGSMGTDTPIAVLQRPAPAAVRLLLAALRPGHQPAARRHPRGAGHQPPGRARPRGQPARPLAGVVPPDRPAPPDHRQRRAGQARPRQRRRRPARAPARSSSNGLYPVAEGGEGLREALEQVRAEVSDAIDDGARIIVLSDRDSRRDLAPIPSLLLTCAVHHHLVRERTRTKVGLVVEAGDAREVHHMALLHRVRRRGHQPVHGLRDARGDVRPRRSSTAGLDDAVRQVHQGAPARACSR